MQIQSTIRRPATRIQPPSSKSQAEKPEDSLNTKVDNFVFGLTGGAALSVAGAAYPTTWMHEMGHAGTIDLLYTNSSPSVEVWPFKGGVTKWQPSELSDLGKKFGPNGARAMVSAAGTIVDMGVAATSFGVGFKLRKEHPIVGTALMGFGGMTVLNSISYAASAVGKNVSELAKSGNDFAGIAVKAGIHPLASIAIMAAILPLEYAALKYLEDH